MSTMVRRAGGSTRYHVPYAPPQPPGADRRHTADAVPVVGFKPVAEPEPTRALQIADLVGGHELDGMRSENAHLAQRATIAQGLEEGGVVSRRGDEARAAREALARSVNVVALTSRPFGRP